MLSTWATAGQFPAQDSRCPEFALRGGCNSRSEGEYGADLD